MSLKCSLFGHAFGDPDVEREREEQGSEVVITIRETEVCQRCGTERVVSENKEVTTLETPDFEDDGDEPPAADTGAASGAVEGSAHADHADEARDAELVDEAEEPTVPDAEGRHPADAVAQVGNDTDAGGSDEVDAPAGPHDDPDADDGVILDDGPAEPESDESVDAGQEPTDVGLGADAGADEQSVEPEREPEPTAEPASIAERNPAAAWPEETEGDEPDWVRETEHTAPDVDPGAGHADAGSAVTVPEGEFYCQECGFTTSVEATSLREGDFCPECQTGSLAHRPESE